MLTTVQKIEQLLWHIFERRQLCEKHKKRLEWEIKEIDISDIDFIDDLLTRDDLEDNTDLLFD
jgi:hypothetical protein